MIRWFDGGIQGWSRENIIPESGLGTDTQGHSRPFGDSFPPSSLNTSTDSNHTSGEARGGERLFRPPTSPSFLCFLSFLSLGFFWPGAALFEHPLIAPGKYLNASLSYWVSQRTPASAGVRGWQIASVRMQVAKLLRRLTWRPPICTLWRALW